jgi:ABC-2 type transport system permease protein
MFLTIFKFEIKYWLKNGAFYVYLTVFFGLSLLSMAGASGAFGEGSASSTTIANSPISIYKFLNLFNKLLLFLLPAIVGSTIYREFKSNFNSILFTYPFTKASYLLAKFTSAFLIVSFIAFSAVIGLIVGTLIPTVNPSMLLPFDILPYVQMYFLFLVPNLILFGVVVFSIVLVSRNIYAGFLGVVVFWLLSEGLTRFISHGSMAGFLLDPFGDIAIQYLTQYWTLKEQNVLPLPLKPIVIYNRLFWLSIAFLVFIVVFRWFSFNQRPFSLGLKTKKSETTIKDNFGSIIKINLIQTKINFSFFQHIKTCWKLAQVDFLFIVKGEAFISMVVAGFFFIAAILLQMNPQTETKTLPVTWVVLGFPVLFFSFVIQILTFLYSGILVHRAKSSRISDLIVSTPIPNWVLLLSKLFALVKMQIVLLLLVMIVGITIQLNQSYYHLEFGHYLFDLLVIHLIGFIIWALLSLLVHTTLSNTYLSLFVLILISLGISQLPSLGVENYVFLFNESPDPSFFLHYSDMNGYGNALTSYFLYKLYWLIFGLILFCLTLLLWRRERTFSLFERLSIAKNRLQGKLAFFTVLFLGIFLSFGYSLYQMEIKERSGELLATNESILLSDFQNKFGKYMHIKQPRIKSVYLELDFFPETNSFEAEGKYTIINRSSQTIDTLMIKMGYDEISKVHFNTKARLIDEDKAFKFYVYKLDNGIPPKDSIILNFSIKNQKNTILTQNSNVLNNGTFLKSDILPRLGYFADMEISHPQDSTAMSNHYQSIDSDLVDFEAILSTTPQQVAITSGNLIREWFSNERRFFHYKMDTPIKFVLGFNVGEFDILEENYKGVELRIYHHPTHTYNRNQMMEGLKASIDYNTTHFGAYQHKQAYIVEFARSEGSYATTVGNCIQMSEVRFINDPNNVSKGGIDLSFYVAAHELTHQWWGNQVIPADVLGATMITESVTEYITAKIYEKKYGKESALKFLNIQRNRYLTGLANELDQEAPLYLVNPEQSYIAYGKGSIALYVLSEYIGEKNLNMALKEYLDNVKYKTTSYTTSLELLLYLEKATPDSLQYLINDMFKTTNSEKTMQHFDNIINRINASNKD